MSKQNKDGFGSKLANNLIVVLLGLISTIIAIYTFLSGNQSIQEVLHLPTNPVGSQSTPTPDLTNLYTFFPHPNIGSVRTYNFSYVYSQGSQDTANQVQETGSYTETIKIVNDVQSENETTIVGVEIAGTNYLSPCAENFYWYVYDRQRLYIVCSKDYVYNLSGEMISNQAPDLVIGSQVGNEPISVSPEYLLPFEIGKEWLSDFYISIKGKVNKTTSLGVFIDCFQVRFWAVNYEEFRYLCPAIGVVAIEVFDHTDYYSAELISFK